MSINHHLKYFKPAGYALAHELDPDFSMDDEPEVVAKVKTYTPRMNMCEHTLNMVTITFELSGLKRNDIAIDFLHDHLTVSGESTVNQISQGKGKYSRREIPHGKFRRAIKVPLGTRPEDFKARMEDGLLTLTYPKEPPHVKPHRIPIA